MGRKIKHILLTGRPKVGKTTLIKRLIKDLDSYGGFYTEEISSDNKRSGFKIITLDGKEGILAWKKLDSKFKLGKYGINIKDLEKIGVNSIENAIVKKEIIVIDEIGKMELFSDRFKEVVLKALDSNKRVLGVIHMADTSFLKKIKSRSDVLILELTKDNHEEIFSEIKVLLRKNKKLDKRTERGV